MGKVVLLQYKIILLHIQRIFIALPRPMSWSERIPFTDECPLLSASLSTVLLIPIVLPEFLSPSYLFAYAGSQEKAR